MTRSIGWATPSIWRDWRRSSIGAGASFGFPLPRSAAEGGEGVSRQPGRRSRPPPLSRSVAQSLPRMAHGAWLMAHGFRSASCS